MSRVVGKTARAYQIKALLAVD